MTSSAADKETQERLQKLERQMTDLYFMAKKTDKKVNEADIRIAMNERGSSAIGEAARQAQETCRAHDEKMANLNRKADIAMAEARRAAQVAEQAKQVAEAAQQEARAAIRRAEAIEARQTEMSVIISKLRALDVNGGNLLPKTDNTAENSIFLAGISQLRAYYRMSSSRDPVEVVSKLLFDTDVYYNMDSVVIADAAAKNNRTAARAVIIHMTSFFHKKMALARIRQLLFKYNLNEVSARDSSPNSVMKEAKWLNRIGASMKRDGVTAKYRIINRRGRPILQTAGRGEPFYDSQNMPCYDEDAMEEETLSAPNNMVTGPPRQRQEQREQQPAEVTLGAARFDEAAFFGARPKTKQQTKQPIDWNADIDKENDERNKKQRAAEEQKKEQKRMEENRAAREQRKREASLDRKKEEEAKREREKRRPPTPTRRERSRSRSRDRSSKSRESSWERRAKAREGGQNWPSEGLPQRRNSQKEKKKAQAAARRDGHSADSRKGD